MKAFTKAFEILEALNEGGQLDDPKNSGEYRIKTSPSGGWVRVPATICLERIRENGYDIQVGDTYTTIKFVV